MIKLSDVSTSNLYSYLFKKAKEVRDEESKKRCLDIADLIYKYCVQDYQQLKDLIESENTKFNIYFLKKSLREVEKKIAEANALGIEPKIYMPNWYESANIDNKTLQITDEQTTGQVLLMSKPISLPSKKQRLISRYTISELKFALGHVRSNLKNKFIYGNIYYNEEDVEKLISAIKFYEEQVVRQTQEIQDMGSASLPINAFEFNKKIKQEIVESQLNEIAEYLVNNGSTFIWGTLSDEEKLRLLKITKMPNYFANRQLVTAISDYTTLSELDKGVVKTKTLDRFIAK